MPRLESREDFDQAARAAVSARQAHKREVLVCCGTGCLANGSMKVAEALQKQIAEKKLDVSLGLYTKKTGCHGFCERGPLVVVLPEGILYTRVKPEHVKPIVETTLEKGEVVTSLFYKDPATKKVVERYGDVPFYKNQTRVAMRNIRRHAKDTLDKMVKDGDAGEDEVRRAEKTLDDLTHKYVTAIDDLLKHKEAELLEV